MIRKVLDGLYLAAGWLAGFFLPGTPANHAAALDHWQRITQASPLNLTFQARKACLES